MIQKHFHLLQRADPALKPSDDLAPGTRSSILKQAGLKERGLMRYATLIERADGDCSEAPKHLQL